MSYRLGSKTAIAAVAALGLVAFAAGSASAADDWDAVVAAAKKEGALVIKGAPGKVYSEVFTQGFKKKYPGITISYTGMNGFEIDPQDPARARGRHL